MKRLIKIVSIIVIAAIIGIVAQISYLYSLSPSENFTKDTFLESATNKTALIIVAHDDDATIFSGTRSMLADKGWDVSFMCFFTEFWKPEINPIRKQEMKNIKEIQGLKDLELIDFTIRRRLDTIEKPWLPIPYDKFSENFEIDSFKASRFVLPLLEANSTSTIPNVKMINLLKFSTLNI